MQALISTVSCRAEEPVPSALFQHDRDAILGRVHRLESRSVSSSAPGWRTRVIREGTRPTPGSRRAQEQPRMTHRVGAMSAVRMA